MRLPSDIHTCRDVGMTYSPLPFFSPPAMLLFFPSCDRQESRHGLQAADRVCSNAPQAGNDPSVFVLQTLEKTKGIEVLKEACAACGEAITARKGRIIIKDEARVVSLPSSPEIDLTCAGHSVCLRLLYVHSILPPSAGLYKAWPHKHDVARGQGRCCSRLACLLPFIALMLGHACARR